MHNCKWIWCTRNSYGSDHSLSANGTILSYTLISKENSQLASIPLLKQINKLLGSVLFIYFKILYAVFSFRVSDKVIIWGFMLEKGRIVWQASCTCGFETNKCFTYSYCTNIRLVFVFICNTSHIHIKNSAQVSKKTISVGRSKRQAQCSSAVSSDATLPQFFCSLSHCAPSQCLC